MPRLRFKARIYDDVHGYIPLTYDELSVIDTLSFQRLKRIYQLGLAHYVYPDATHTRFSHSIGVVHVAYRISTSLIDQGRLDPDDIPLVRMAALLHDVGHYPLSHCLERFFEGRGGPPHEELSAYMIIHDRELREAIVKAGLDPEEVAKVIEGRHSNPLINSLLSSDVDSDRLDYLLRDARHTGVAYGLIDLERILDTLTVDSEGSLAIMAKGLQAVESFYLARLHMYQAIYHHKTIVGFVVHLEKILDKLLEQGFNNILELLCDREGVEKLIEDEEFKWIDDYWLHSLLRRALHDNKVSDEVKTLIKYFYSRRGFKSVFDASHFSNDPEPSKESLSILREVEEKLIDLGIPEDAIQEYIAKITVFAANGSVPKVVFNDGREEPLNSPLVGSVLATLPRYYHVLRVYVRHDYVPKARDIVKSVR